MDALNLTLQIAYGYLLQNATVVISILLAFIVLYGVMIVKKLALLDGQCIKTALLAGGFFWVIFIVTLPTMTQSSLAQVTYSTDWFMLLFMSFGYAAIGATLMYPALRLFKSAKQN